MSDKRLYRLTEPHAIEGLEGTHSEQLTILRQLRAFNDPSHPLFEAAREIELELFGFEPVKPGEERVGGEFYFEFEFGTEPVEQALASWREKYDSNSNN